MGKFILLFINLFRFIFHFDTKKLQNEIAINQFITESLARARSNFL